MIKRAKAEDAEILAALAFLMLEYTEIIGLPTMSIAMQLLCRNV